MKKGDKVKTWTSTMVGVVTKVYPDHTVDVKYKGINAIDHLPVSMCVKV